MFLTFKLLYDITILTLLHQCFTPSDQWNFPQSYIQLSQDGPLYILRRRRSTFSSTSMFYPIRSMEFSIKLHTIKSGWSIVYIEESQKNHCLIAESVHYSGLMTEILTNLSQREFPTLTNWTSPFPF